MFQVQQTEHFERWLFKLKDRRATARILARLDSLRLGNLGDCKSLGGGLSELRIHVGPGYRLYFAMRGGKLAVLLCGGDKSTQQSDINRAKRLMSDLWQENER